MFFVTLAATWSMGHPDRRAVARGVRCHAVRHVGLTARVEGTRPRHSEPASHDRTPSTFYRQLCPCRRMQPSRRVFGGCEGSRIVPRICQSRSSSPRSACGSPQGSSQNIAAALADTPSMRGRYRTRESTLSWLQGPSSLCCHPFHLATACDVLPSVWDENEQH